MLCALSQLVSSARQQTEEESGCAPFWRDGGKGRLVVRVALDAQRAEEDKLADGCCEAVRAMMSGFAARESPRA